MANRWLVIAHEPNTCELVVKTYQWPHPVFPGVTVTRERRDGCRYYCIQDGLDNTVPEVICAVERTCLAHAPIVAFPKDKMRWPDGNWKHLPSYISYQKKWGLWLLKQEWEAGVAAGYRSPDEPMPPNIVGFLTEPPTAGTVMTPLQAEIDDMEQVYNWNMDHNGRVQTTNAIMESLGAKAEIANLETLKMEKQFSFRFEGTGDTRLLYVNSGGQLSTQQLRTVRDTADIQFGPGKVVVEG